MIKEVRCPKCSFRILFSNEEELIACSLTRCPKCKLIFMRVYNLVRCLGCGGCDRPASQVDK